jgi:hypothetical protein
VGKRERECGERAGREVVSVEQRKNRITQAVAEFGQEEIVQVAKLRVALAYLPFYSLPQNHDDVNCVFTGKEATHHAGLLLRAAQINLERAQTGRRLRGGILAAFSPP